MKKGIKITLLLVLAILLVASMCACSKDDTGFDRSEFYQAYNVTEVYVEQKTTNTFLYKVKTDVEITANTKVYITRYEKLPASVEAIAFANENGALVFTATVPYERYFIRVVDGDKNALMPMAKPMFAPKLDKVKGIKPSNVVTYNFVEGTSWSSFCDPTGKAVYRSASRQFDDSAEVVAKNVQIAGVDSTTDSSPVDSKPYYYVVLTAKNGVVTYVSTPLMDYDSAFKDISATLEIVNDKATLVVNGKFKIAGDVAIEVYSEDEKLGSVTEVVGEFVNGNADESFRATLDLTNIINNASGKGIWYDIKLATSAGLLFDIPANVVDMGDSIQVAGTTVKFEEWSNLLKLSYTF